MIQEKKTMSTYMAKPNEIAKKWYVIDAEGKPLGRVASQAATILRGKHRPYYTPHVDTGDFVIIINSDKAILTGNKENDKMYRHHSGYMGGLKEFTYKQMVQRKPEFPMYAAIKGMLPKSSLGRKMLKKLKIYSGSEHPHQAQQPEMWEI